MNPENPTLVTEDTNDVKEDTDSKIETNTDTTDKPEGPKMSILDKREQGYVYRRIVGQIKRLLKNKLKGKADKLALDYQDFFENTGSNEQFIKQVNRIYKEFKLESPLQ